MLLKVAWRNIWRSKRRSLITIMSIFFAVVFAVLYRALIVGLLDKTIADTVSLSCGYIQIHHNGYWENKSVDNTFNETPRLTAILNKDKDVATWNPHLESFALASSGDRTRGIMVTGIEPEKENAFSNLANKLIAGKYLESGDKNILVAEGLADYLKLNVYDTIVLLGQGFHGEIAAGKYAVKGIVRLGIAEMNKGMVWLSLGQSQNFLGTGDRLSSISIMVSNINKLDGLKKDLIKQTKGLDYEVMTWQQMIPELDQFFHMEMAGDYGMMVGILYLVIAFGIFGTILMMLKERMHEFGILIAIGMRKGMIAATVVMETILIAISGTVLGMLGAFPLVLYFRLHPIPLGVSAGKMVEQFNIEPIIQPSMDISNFIIQGMVVLIIVSVLSLYAIYNVHKLKCINAINS